MVNGAESNSGYVTHPQLQSEVGYKVHSSYKFMFAVTQLQNF